MLNDATNSRTSGWLVQWVAVSLATVWLLSRASAEEAKPNPAPVTAAPVAPQSAVVPAGGSGRGGGYQAQRAAKKGTLDDQVNALAKRLALNDTQKTQVKEILKRRRDAFARIQGDGSLSGVDRIAKYRALQEKTKAQLKSVLTPEQQQKMGWDSGAAKPNSGR
jgi:Spy/CpxP family protein refolding chaperone